MFAALFSIIGSITSIITSLVALGLAVKFLLLGLVALVLPIILKNLFLWIMDKMLFLASSGVSDYDAPSLTYQFTGLGAYIADQMQLPLALSIVLTAVAIRFILRSMRIL